MCATTKAINSRNTVRLRRQTFRTNKTVARRGLLWTVHAATGGMALGYISLSDKRVNAGENAAEGTCTGNGGIEDCAKRGNSYDDGCNSRDK